MQMPGLADAMVVMLTVGVGETMTALTAWLVQPVAASMPITLYVVVEDGLTLILLLMTEPGFQV